MVGNGCQPFVTNVDLYQVYSHEVINHLLTSVIEKDYFGNDLLQKTKTISYDPFWRKRNEILQVGNTLKSTESYYLNDYQTGTITNSSILKAKNIINKVIKQREILNGTLIASNVSKYNTSGLLSTSYSYYSDVTEIATPHQNSVEIPSKHQKDFDLYYHSGSNKPKDYVPTNSVRSAFIWGLGNTELMALVKGLSYAAVLNLYSIDYSILNGSQNAVLRKNELDNLANAINNSGSKIELADYSPKAGIKWKKGESGIQSYFNYDGSGRLNSINNHFNNALKGFQYHFSNTNF
jgi:hypothetical protein